MAQLVFLLSPARCDGRRARMLLNPQADFALAQRLRSDAGLPLGEAFSFMSGLYFRGKLGYARAFARGVIGSGVHVIAPGFGLLDPDHAVRVGDLERMGEVGVSPGSADYRDPLDRDVARIATSMGGDDRVVLLGSIATDKYAEILLARLAERLVFPREFVGRGDMSRGGLMLRCVDEGRELETIPVTGAIRRGPRPPRLEPLHRHRASLARG
jgi:hypothetical protein